MSVVAVFDKNNFSIPSPEEGVSHYISVVSKFPFLSLEKEYEYAVALRERGDINAARELVLSHLRLVVKIARSYSGYGLYSGDLIQEGNIGLMKAVKKFNPMRGVRLATFATYWIKAEIHEFIIRNWKIVKIATTKSQRKLFFNLRRLLKTRDLSAIPDSEAQKIADTLDVKKTDVLEMGKRMGNPDVPFDIEFEQDKKGVAPAQYLTSYDLDAETQMIEEDDAECKQQALRSALDELDARSRDILESRWLAVNEAGEKTATLQELAERYHISPERVRQVEKQAFSKIRNHIESNSSSSA